MNQTTPQHQITYRFERNDFTAMTRAMTRRPWTRKVAMVAVWFLVVLVFLFLFRAAALEFLDPFVRTILLDFLPLWVIGILALLFSSHLMGLSAALIFKHNALACQDIDLLLRKSGIESRTSDMRAEFTWGMVKKIIETDSHLFLTLSRREGLILPRRAFASDDAYRAARDFIAHHAGPQVPMSKL